MSLRVEARPASCCTQVDHVSGALTYETNMATKRGVDEAGFTGLMKVRGAGRILRWLAMDKRGGGGVNSSG